MKPLASAALFIALGLATGYVAPGCEPHRVQAADTQVPAPRRAEPVYRVYARPSLDVEPVAQPAQPEQTKQIDRAYVVVDDAVARGVWTDADREALREQLDDLPSETQVEITARMADAVNRGQLRIAADIPL